MQKGAAATLPLDLILDAIPSLPRPLLARMVQRMIDRIDELDGDTDVEPNGDEEDGSYCAEDEHDMPCGMEIGAGCPFSDAGEEDYRRSPRPTYDGEDCGAVVLYAPKGFPPTTWRIS